MGLGFVPPLPTSTPILRTQANPKSVAHASRYNRCLRPRVDRRLFNVKPHLLQWNRTPGPVTQRTTEPPNDVCIPPCAFASLSFEGAILYTSRVRSASRFLAAFTALSCLYHGPCLPKAWAQAPRHTQNTLPSLDELTEALQDGMDRCGTGAVPPQACAQELEELLEKLRAHSAQAAKRRSLQLIIRRAKLKLFTVHRQSGSPNNASFFLEDIISVSPLSQHELLELGPTLASEAQASMQRIDLKARGTIEVSCERPCAVSVNDTLVDNPVSLPIGNYRLTVVGLTAEPVSLVRSVKLKFKGQQKKLRFENRGTSNAEHTPKEPTPPFPPARPAAEAPRPLLDPKSTEPLQHGTFQAPLDGPWVAPILPRRAMQIGMATALVTSATGAALWSMSGYCTDHYEGVTDIKGNAICEPGKRLDTQAAGIAVLSVGAAALFTGSILLGMERARGRRLHQPHLAAYTAAQVRARHFPRWFELTGAGLGLTSIVWGSIALGFDGKQISGKSYNYSNKRQSVALLVTGAQFLAFSGIFLAIDEWPRHSRPRVKPQGLGFRF